MLTLRPYQREAADAGIKFLTGNEKGGAIIVAPTGSGKSIITAEVAHSLNDHVLVLQPSLEILESNYEKMLLYVDEEEVGIFSASADKKDIRRITFATIGSIINKKEMFSHFKYLIIDECHTVNAKGGMYQELIDFLGGKVLGLTATPYRLHAYTDFRTGALSVVAKFLHRTRPRMFSKIIHITQIKDLYDQKFLCPVDYKENKDYNHSEIKLNSTGMDFDEKSLFAYNEAHNVIQIAASIISREVSEHILVFMASVDEATRLSEYLLSQNISAAIISAKTHKKDRAAILAKFKTGEIRVVCNFGTLTTGYDFPALDCVILGRPTQSIALYYQMLGRGIRIAPGKEKVSIVDICGNVKRFGRIEDFEIMEATPGMHRLKSNTSFLTGYDFYHNCDVEAKNYEGLRETEFAKRDEIVQFGAHKGTHITKIPNGYLNWACDNLTGKWQTNFKKERDRREKSRANKLAAETVPF